MADRILTFQQSSVLMDCEDLLRMIKKGGDRKVMQNTWDGILDLVVLDAELYPKDLHPDVAFEEKFIFGDRVPPRVVIVYLHRLHKHLDALNSKHVRR